MLVGLSFYVVARTSRVALWSPRLARIALLALEPGSPRRARDPAGRRESRPAGVPRVGVAAGGHPGGGRASSPDTWRIAPWPRERCPRSTCPTGTSSAAFCCLPILYVTSYLPFYQAGLGNTVVQGYYMHNAMGMWFTQLALGVSYYAIPLAARPAGLLLRPRRPRFLDQSPLLPADRRASLHLQPGGVVAPEHGHPLQRGHDGAGVGRDGELAPDLQGRSAARSAAAMRCRSS